MYGTIARMKVKPGMVDDLRRWNEEQDRQNGASGPGIMLVYQSDTDPNELYLVVAAESREAYRAVSESPAQHERFLGMMEFLAAEPEWHDGAVIDSRFEL